MKWLRACRCSPVVRFILAALIAAAALGLQLLLHPIVAPDTYQIFIAGVALSAILLGTPAGLFTLALESVAKLHFFLPPILPLNPESHKSAARLILFIAVGFVVGSIAGRLRASEEVFSAVLSSIDDAVVAMDENGEIRFLNPAAQLLSGWNQEEAFGQDFRTLFSIDAEGSGYFLRRRDGREIPVEYVIAPIRGAPGGRVMVLRDITERQRSEAEREKLIVELRSALAQVKQLSGMLPICASCKKIRDDQGYWHQIESYIRSHSEAEFSHGICPDCMRKLYPEYSGKHDK